MSSQGSKERRDLAAQLLDSVLRESAGEFGRAHNFSQFVAGIRDGHYLQQLAVECYRAMTDDEKRQFQAMLESIKPRQ